MKVKVTEGYFEKPNGFYESLYQNSSNFYGEKTDALALMLLNNILKELVSGSDIIMRYMRKLALGKSVKDLILDYNSQKTVEKILKFFVDFYLWEIGPGDFPKTLFPFLNLFSYAEVSEFSAKAVEKLDFLAEEKAWKLIPYRDDSLTVRKDLQKFQAVIISCVLHHYENNRVESFLKDLFATAKIGTYFAFCFYTNRSEMKIPGYYFPEKESFRRSVNFLGLSVLEWQEIERSSDFYLLEADKVPINEFVFTVIRKIS